MYEMSECQGFEKIGLILYSQTKISSESVEYMIA